MGRRKEKTAGRKEEGDGGFQDLLRRPLPSYFLDLESPFQVLEFH